MNTIDISNSQEIYTVSRLNREVRYVLEDNFPLIWVEGEISNFAAPHSGHWYFSLKDNVAQVRCAIFKPNNRKLGFIPRDGMQVLVKARISLYEGRGDFQLLIEHMEEAGEGRLRQEFEALKKRLLEAGLFDAAHKKSLPNYPRTIGVITSPTGAAIQDILSVLSRRYRSANIIIYPTLVQGELAAQNIVAAIQTANTRNECDVLILARGGGSLEDLWPFNEEKVAHAIYASHLPIISGVGHEVDFTIADFVADVRAPTPSAAAELVAPETNELLDMLAHYQKQIARCMVLALQKNQQSLAWLEKHLQQQHPRRRLTEQTQQLDLAEMTLIRLQNQFLSTLKARLQTLTAKLLSATPQHKIRELTQHLAHLTTYLENASIKLISNKQQKLGSLAATLDALSPLATLKRGFAIATRDKDSKVILHASDVAPGDKMQVRLLDGTLECRVENTVNAE